MTNQQHYDSLIISFNEFYKKNEKSYERAKNTKEGKDYFIERAYSKYEGGERFAHSLGFIDAHELHFAQMSDSQITDFDPIAQYA